MRQAHESIHKSQEDAYNFRNVDSRAYEGRRQRDQRDAGYASRQNQYQFEEEPEYGATDRSSFSSLRANDEMKGKTH